MFIVDDFPPFDRIPTYFTYTYVQALKMKMKKGEKKRKKKKLFNVQTWWKSTEMGVHKFYIIYFCGKNLYMETTHYVALNCCLR